MERGDSRTVCFVEPPLALPLGGACRVRRMKALHWHAICLRRDLLEDNASPAEARDDRLLAHTRLTALMAHRLIEQAKRPGRFEPPMRQRLRG
jgi:hypothetical protein